MLQDIFVEPDPRDPRGLTVIKDIYLIDDTGTATQYLLRDRYAVNREWRKRVNQLQQVSPYQDIPYDQYRYVHSWVGHIDCKKESLAGDTVHLDRLQLASFISNDFKHSYAEYVNNDPTVPRVDEIIQHAADAVNTAWPYDIYNVPWTTSDGWEVIPEDPPRYAFTDVWVIKSTDISDINDGIGCRVTITLEKKTTWFDAYDTLSNNNLTLPE